MTINAISHINATERSHDRIPNYPQRRRRLRTLRDRPGSAGQKAGHALINHTSQPCRYLVLGNPQPHDVVVFTDSGRVSVRLTGESYRQSETMDYWEGV